jgi:hypothetical protein
MAKLRPFGIGQVERRPDAFAVLCDRRAHQHAEGGVQRLVVQRRLQRLALRREHGLGLGAMIRGGTEPACRFDACAVG